MTEDVDHVAHMNLALLLKLLLLHQLLLLQQLLLPLELLLLGPVGIEPAAVFPHKPDSGGLMGCSCLLLVLGTSFVGPVLLMGLSHGPDFFGEVICSVVTRTTTEGKGTL